MWETLRLLYCWYWHEGWEPLLSCLTLGLCLFMVLDHWRMHKEVARLGLIYRGIDQRLVDNYQHLETKVVQVERRATLRFEDGAFEKPEGNNDETRVRKRRKGDQT
jgi:hypothetical protein